MIKRSIVGSVVCILLAVSAGCGGASAESRPAKAQPVPAGDGPAVEARELGSVANGECSTKGFIAQMGATCGGMPSRNAHAGRGQAQTAADGDACTIWNSGGMPPQTMDVDLEHPSLVSGMLLIPDMTPPEGDVLHVIERSDDGDTFLPVAIVKRHMIAGHAYGVTFPQKVTTRYLRVSTMSSPSWVAWAELAPIKCG
jgi:hypothetical protein